MMDMSKSFGLCERFCGESLCCISGGLDLSYTMKPVLHPGSVDDICEYLLICSLDKDEYRGFITTSYFGGQSCFGQGSDELLELFKTSFFV